MRQKGQSSRCLSPMSLSEFYINVWAIRSTSEISHQRLSPMSSSELYVTVWFFMSTFELQVDVWAFKSMSESLMSTSESLTKSHHVHIHLTCTHTHTTCSNANVVWCVCVHAQIYLPMERLYSELKVFLYIHSLTGCWVFSFVFVKILTLVRHFGGTWGEVSSVYISSLCKYHHSRQHKNDTK